MGVDLLIAYCNRADLVGNYDSRSNLYGNKLRMKKHVVKWLISCNCGKNQTYVLISSTFIGL